MKKVLFATTALVLTAGMAAAEVKFSGSARVGLVYNETDTFNAKDTQVNLRLRFNIDAFKELDSGVTLGGRIRLQYDDGDENLSGTEASGDGEGGAELSAAYVYAEVAGFHVEAGNANGAFDSLGTLYNSEFGYVGTTQGSYNLVPSYQAFSSGPYDATYENQMGLFVSYEVGGLVARLSYHTPDQTVEDSIFIDGPFAGELLEDEISVSLDYTSGPFSVGFGYLANGGYVDGNNAYALLGEYAINDTTKVGLQFISTESDFTEDNSGVTLYGSTDLNGVGLGGFISTTDEDGVENDVAYGLGASYDLGGATLAGTIQQGFDEDIYADVGVTFSF